VVIAAAFYMVDLSTVTTGQLDVVVLGLAALSILFMRDVRKSAIIVVLAVSIRSFFGVNPLVTTHMHQTDLRDCRQTLPHS
jgi:hypothetical protein